jgi:hypothetical protein
MDAGSHPPFDQASIARRQRLHWCEKGQCPLGRSWKRPEEYADIATWQMGRGRTQKSVVAEPRFADPSRGDWTIEPQAKIRARSHGSVDQRR